MQSLRGESIRNIMSFCMPRIKPIKPYNDIYIPRQLYRLFYCVRYSNSLKYTIEWYFSEPDNLSIYLQFITHLIQKITIIMPVVLCKKWYTIIKENIECDVKQLNRFMKRLKLMKTIINSLIVRNIFKLEFNPKNFKINCSWEKIDTCVKMSFSGRTISKYLIIGNYIKINNKSCIISRFDSNSKGPTMLIAYYKCIVMLSKLYQNNTFRWLINSKTRIKMNEEDTIIRIGDTVYINNEELFITNITSDIYGIPEELCLYKQFNIPLYPHGKGFTSSQFDCSLSGFSDIFAYTFL